MSVLNKTETHAAIEAMQAVEDAHALADPTFAPAESEVLSEKPIGKNTRVPWSKTHNGPGVTLEPEQLVSRSDVGRAQEAQERKAEERAARAEAREKAEAKEKAEAREKAEASAIKTQDEVTTPSDAQPHA